MTEGEWTSGMMVADEQILAHIEEIEQTIASAKDTFKDYRPLLGGDRWISDREAAEFLQVSRHTLLSYRRSKSFPMCCLAERYSIVRVTC